MQRRVGIWFGLATASLLAIVGCAVGAQDDDGTSSLDNVPIEAGSGDDASSITLKPPTPATGDDAGEDDDGSAPKKDGGGDAGTPVDGGGTVNSCAATDTCLTATDLGQISGDTGSDVKTTQGTTSSWFQVRLHEDDSGLFANSLEMKAALTSPAGSNFDLYVYVPADDVRECSAVSAKSVLTSAVDTAGVEFGESGTFSDGDDNSRTVTVEVRWVSGTCSPTSKWTLTLTGNTH